MSKSRQVLRTWNAVRNQSQWAKMNSEALSIVAHCWRRPESSRATGCNSKPDASYKGLCYAGGVFVALLGAERSRATPAPIYGLSVMGLDCIASLEAGSQEESLVIPGDGWLVFKARDSAVQIYSSQTKNNVAVDLVELRGAWEHFALRVVQFIVSEFPELRERPEFKLGGSDR
jgi:hypothetical protein